MAFALLLAVVVVTAQSAPEACASGGACAMVDLDAVEALEVAESAGVEVRLLQNGLSRDRRKEGTALRKSTLGSEQPPVGPAAEHNMETSADTTADSEAVAIATSFFQVGAEAGANTTTSAARTAKNASTDLVALGPHGAEILTPSASMTETKWKLFSNAASDATLARSTPMMWIALVKLAGVVVVLLSFQALFYIRQRRCMAQKHNDKTEAPMNKHDNPALDRLLENRKVSCDRPEIPSRLGNLGLDGGASFILPLASLREHSTGCLSFHIEMPMRPAVWSLSVHLSRGAAAGSWEKIALTDESIAMNLPPSLLQLQPKRSETVLLCERQAVAEGSGDAAFEIRDGSQGSVGTIHQRGAKDSWQLFDVVRSGLSPWEIRVDSTQGGNLSLEVYHEGKELARVTERHSDGSACMEAVMLVRTDSLRSPREALRVLVCVLAVLLLDV